MTELEKAANEHAELRQEALKHKEEWPQECVLHESFNGFICGAKWQANKNKQLNTSMEDYTEVATYLRIALALQNISVPPIIAEQIVETLEAVKSKGGEFTLEDACQIQTKYDVKQKENS